VEGLDLQAWGVSLDPMAVDIRMDADVTGRAAMALGSGEVELVLHDGARELEVRGRVLARADSVGGPWVGEWSLRSAGVEAEGTGMVAPGDPLASAIQGRMLYDRSAGAPPVPGPDLPFLQGSFRWEGQGTGLESLEGVAELRIDTAVVNRASVAGLVLAAETSLGRTSVRLDGGVAGGRFSARGDGDLRDRTGRLVEARMENVDVASLAGDTVPSAVWATAQGVLESLEPLRGGGSLRVDRAEYGEARLDSASVEGEIRGEVADLRLAAALPDSGLVRLAGVLDGSGGSPRARVDSLVFAHLDLRALLGGGENAGTPSTHLTGSGHADLAAVPGGWEGQAVLDLAPSRVGNQALEEGRIALDLVEADAGIELDLRTPEGGVAALARLEGLDTLPAVVVPEFRFQALDVGALLGRDDLEVRLWGRLEGSFRGATLEDMVGEGRLVLEESILAGVPVETATLDVRVDGGRALSTLRGRVAEGSVRGEAQARLGAMSPEELNLEARLELDSLAWEGARLERGRLRLAVADGVLRLDTLFLRSPEGLMGAAGKLPLSAAHGRDGEIRFGGDLAGGDVLSAFTGAEVAALGSGVLEGALSGSLDHLEMTATAAVDALLLEDLRVQGMELEGQALWTEAEGFAQGTGTLLIQELDHPSLSLQRLEAQARREPGEDLTVTASAVMDHRRDAALSARVEVSPSPLAVLLDRLEVRLDEDRWALAEPVRVDLSDGMTIDSLAFQAGSQEILARGRMGARGPLDFRMEAREVRIGGVAEMLGRSDLRGSVSGVVLLEGTGESPLMDAAFSSRLEPTGGEPADLDLDASFSDESLVFEAVARLEGGRSVRAGGALPLNFSLAAPSRGLVDGEPVLVEAAADSLPLEWVGHFVPSDVARNLQGFLDGSVRMEGRPEAPRLSGSMEFTDASARIPALGLEYRRGGAQLRFQEETIHLDSLRIRSGGGTLEASGTVTLPRLDQPEFAVNVSAEGFHAIRASGVDATVTAELEISGSAERPALSGWLELERAEFQLGDMVTAPGVETVTLSEEDYQELAEVFGYRRPPERGPPSDFFELSSLDLEVRLRRDSWVRQRANPEMAVQFAGEVAVRKEPGDSIRLVGTVETVPRRSYVEQFGRRFSIASGSLDFQGTPAATRVDLRAEYAVPSRDNPDAPQVVVVLNITGTPEDLRLELSSSPPLDPSDMVAYMVTGRPAAETLGGSDEGGSLTDAGEAFALGRLSGAVEAYAREQVGLDVVEITTDGLQGMILVAGRYVSPSLYLGIRQPLSLQRSSGDASERPPEPELEVELEAVRWLLVNLQVGGRSGLELFLRSRIAYD
jgi:hypothetical protein